MFLSIIAVAIIIQRVLAQNCQLNATFMDKKWIYATKPTDSNWDILHTDYIRDQATLYLLCTRMSNGRELFCNRGILEDKNTTNISSTCSKRINAETVLLTNEKSCRRQNGDFYQVRYNLPNNTTVPLYNICYSKLNEQVIYSRHKTYGSDLSASTYKRPTFQRGAVVSRRRERSFEPANIYNRFVTLLGTNQRYVTNNRTLILERGHLVNSQDFSTYDQMDATYKYINVIPQFRGSNRSNWKRIENWINRLPSSSTYPEVVTGSFGILSLPHSDTNEQVEMYLMPNKKNPIPLWLYKVVKYRGICYVFITLNNDFNTNANLSTNYCSIVLCPTGLQFRTAHPSGISYCCNYNNIVHHIGRHAVLC